MAEHKLKNGWTVVEAESVESVWFGGNKLSNGGSGKYLAKLNRFPSTKRVRVWHLKGSTPEERQKMLVSGILAARGKLKDYPWRKYRVKGKTTYGFVCVVGIPMDVAGEFERLTRGLMTDEAVDLEFNQLAESLEGQINA